MSKWTQQVKLAVNTTLVSPSEECPLSETTRKLPQCDSSPPSLSPPCSFLLQSECNQLWHEKTRSLSVRTLLVLCWQSSTDSPSRPSLNPSIPHHSNCLPLLTSAVLMNIKMPLGPPEHLWSLGRWGFTLKLCTLSPASSDYCSLMGLSFGRCEKIKLQKSHSGGKT